MKISELKAGMCDVEVEVLIKGLSGVDHVESADGFELRLKKADVADDSGTIKLILFNDKIDQVREGGRYRIKGADVSVVSNSLTLQLPTFCEITPLD
jgi:hypothetical protein